MLPTTWRPDPGKHDQGVLRICPADGNRLRSGTGGRRPVPVDRRRGKAAANPPLVRGGLAAITLVTADETAMRHFLVDGFGMQERPLPERTAEQSATQAALWVLTGIQGWKEIWLEDSGDAAAPAVRVLIIPNVTPRTRDAISAVRDGGVSMSFALAKGSGALGRLKATGIDYFSQFQVPLAKPGGGTYVVEEFYFAGPVEENGTY